MAELKPNKSPTLADDVFQTLRVAIVKGELPPGSKINEPNLAKELGVSRGPLREAIRRLEGCKLIELRPNAGARVVELSAEQLLEIYEIREALEGYACRLAAERASDKQINELRRLLSEHKAGIKVSHGKMYYQAEGEWDYHYQLVEMSGNKRLFNLLCGELYHLMRLYRVRASTSPQRPKQAFKEHEAILDAIANRDPELAEMLMRRHIRGAQIELLAQINSESIQPQKSSVKKQPVVLSIEPTSKE